MRPTARARRIAPDLASMLASLAVCMLALLAASTSSAAVLYDGSLNTTPDAQDWFYGCYPQPCPALQNAQGGVTTLDSTGATDTLAGYFASFQLTFPPINFRHPLLPTLDRTAGYRVRFDARILSEDHGTRVDRAGLSLIVISEDLKGLELGFWPDEVWAQADAPVFTHAEGVAFDTTRALVAYELCVQGDGYTLTADGAVLLSGALRDYYTADNCSCCSPPVPCPYSWPSHVFVGDDTTSAAIAFELARVEVTAGQGGAPVIGNSLLAARQGSDIQLEVAPLVPATEYHLYRDTSPPGIGTTLFASSPVPAFPPDSQSLPAPETFYFSVRAPGPCGLEYP